MAIKGKMKKMAGKCSVFAPDTDKERATYQKSEDKRYRKK